MGSINDYLRGGGRPAERPPKRRFGGRLMGQLSLSLILFLIVAASVNSDNILGQGARYVMGDGISAATSWLPQENALPVDSAGADLDMDNAIPLPEVSPADDGEQPGFTAPASGVVVTDIAVTAGGFAGSKGILISGNAGQSVKAAADGTVADAGSSDNGYTLRIDHSGGFASVYQGLSRLTVSPGATLQAGEEVGVTDSGEVTFSLLLNDTEVDPLDYLFQ